MCRIPFSRSTRLRTDFAEKRDSIGRPPAPQPEAASSVASASVRLDDLINALNAGASAPAAQITGAGLQAQDIALDIANPASVASSSQSAPPSRSRFTYPGLPIPPPPAADIADQQDPGPSSPTGVPQPAPRSYDRTRRNGVFFSPEAGQALRTASRAWYVEARQVRSRSENINARGGTVDITALFEEQLRTQRRPRRALDAPDDVLCRV